jgi:transcriptional regulator with AAA-type ATPase domain
VMIMGETGTGKDLIAHAIQYNSTSGIIVQNSI